MHLKGLTLAIAKKLRWDAIVNWVGDNAFGIHSNFTWANPGDKDDPDKVLSKFEKYFKPAYNKYHLWYTLGTTYSSQFKSMVK